MIVGMVPGPEHHRPEPQRSAEQPGIRVSPNGAHCAAGAQVEAHAQHLPCPIPGLKDPARPGHVRRHGLLQQNMAAVAEGGFGLRGMAVDGCGDDGHVRLAAGEKLLRRVIDWAKVTGLAVRIHRAHQPDALPARPGQGDGVIGCVAAYAKERNPDIMHT